MTAPLVPTPPCANPKKHGHCGTCWYCDNRLHGPDYWARTPRPKRNTKPGYATTTTTNGARK